MPMPTGRYDRRTMKMSFSDSPCGMYGSHESIVEWVVVVVVVVVVAVVVVVDEGCCCW